MAILKPFISLLLIATYLVGFGHALTPHHLEEFHTHSSDEVHHHEHHSHHEDDSENHAHISHGDHYDHGWLDLFVCLISDLEHHGSNHSHQFVFKGDVRQIISHDEVKKAHKQFDLYYHIGSSQNVVAKAVNNILLNKALHPYSYLYYESHPLRGPPVYSC